MFDNIKYYFSTSAARAAPRARVREYI